MHPDEEVLYPASRDVEAIALPALNVNVEFNDLLERYGELQAFRMIGDLKDMLR